MSNNDLNFRRLVLNWKTVNNALLFPTGCEMIDFPTTPSVWPVEIDLTLWPPCWTAETNFPQWESKGSQKQEEDLFLEVQQVDTLAL